MRDTTAMGHPETDGEIESRRSYPVPEGTPLGSFMVDGHEALTEQSALRQQARAEQQAKGDAERLAANAPSWNPNRPANVHSEVSQHAQPEVVTNPENLTAVYTIMTDLRTLTGVVRPTYLADPTPRENAPYLNDVKVDTPGQPSDPNDYGLAA